MFNAFNSVDIGQIFSTLSFYLHLVSVPVIIVSVAAIIIFSLKVSEIRAQQKEQLFTPTATGTAEPKVVKNQHWERIKEHINSDSLNDWKAAIIEADMVLDSLLDKLNYTGDSLGEKLKQVEPSDFLTLDRAWEAHKVRNSIAHDPTFTLDHRKAQRAVENYRAVFEEFHYI